MRDLAEDLSGALARGEIRPWFQPQVDLESMTIVAAEALCRWRHPELGYIPPSEFIPLAERTGDIHAIGMAMIEQSCSALREWSYRGHPIQISVNVSPLQLRSAVFTRWLEAHLEQLRLPAGALTLEITESEPIENVRAVVGRLDRLRALGLGIAIDDFGVGQASLTQLKRLHGTELKLDRSLVADGSEVTTAFLTEVVKIAHDSGISVVAEGVETDAELARVTELGCDRAQGYLLGRPMPREDLSALLRAG